jgi:hypothetical protein
MIETSGFSLSIQTGIYKPSASVNGVQVKIGINNVFTLSGSALLNPDGTAESNGATFGNGLFYNAAAKTNALYIGAPTVANAAPKFAGIIIRSMGVEGSYPNGGELVHSHNKFDIARDGYWRYRSGITTAGAALVFSNAVILIGAYAYVRNTDGAVAFGSAATAAGFTTIGRISELNPDDQSWVVHVDSDNSVFTAAA